MRPPYSMNKYIQNNVHYLLIMKLTASCFHAGEKKVAPQLKNSSVYSSPSALEESDVLHSKQVKFQEDANV